ncbi:SHOCT domain-containing protein [Thioflexithrix psekupsensis]|uniref:SHOCT domain-containing protein n=1 Tax=Thioflexithrix psekupsensis TaxID=1570016 RepID=A0A251X5G6_9GAMM|nr:SHOCT domain-containing protein [Thioflexithrix psekupsensis]OUD12898.1 hypothetical protein TPSD3_12205 [Thioflexithrix psekupsensis]
MNLTEQGEYLVNDLSRRYGVSVDAVTTLLQAVLNGNGTMAQFSHPELGGSGQWMQGGMTMVGDMFNYQLKTLVNGLCSELSQQLASQTLIKPLPVASGGGYGMSSGNNWWPSELGYPSASGSQNQMRYAYFSDKRRLALQINGQLSVYDTQDHAISGFSQQQGSGGSVLFNSQYGTVDVLRLPLLRGSGTLPNSSNVSYSPDSSNNSSNLPPAESFSDSAAESDIFGKIERLAELKQKGILSEEEFLKKKAELLARL